MVVGVGVAGGGVSKPQNEGRQNYTDDRRGNIGADTVFSRVLLFSIVWCQTFVEHIHVHASRAFLV